MVQFFEHLFAKIISAVATFIIALGVVQMTPVTQYEIPPHKTPRIEVIKNGGAEKIPPSRKIIIPTQPASNQEKNLQPETPAISSTELNIRVRKTIVNIICTNQISGPFKAITGSGVIVSPKGVILTNAHIGQYFLLENTPETGYLNCSVRNGDIAQSAYDAKLVFIPSRWIEENAENIIEQQPKGTGENDYAFLLITRSAVEGTPLPQTFDFTEPNLDFNILPANLSVFLASYPAGFLGGTEVQKNLGLTSTFDNISGLYTFATTGPATLDLFSIKGSIVSQGGSSGGAAVDARNGKLLGIITTSSEATTTAGRILNAITLSHINRSFEKYNAQPLSYFLETPEDYNFLPQPEFNRLKDLLVSELKKR